MIWKSGNRFSEKIVREENSHDPEKWDTGFPKRSCANKIIGEG
jgi:hypothetical protein